MSFVEFTSYWRTGEIQAYVLNQNRKKDPLFFSRGWRVSTHGKFRWICWKQREFLSTPQQLSYQSISEGLGNDWNQIYCLSNKRRGFLKIDAFLLIVGVLRMVFTFSNTVWGLDDECLMEEFISKVLVNCGWFPVSTRRRFDVVDVQTKRCINVKTTSSAY